MHTPAWNAVDLIELWGFNVATRGQNTLFPGVPGTDPNPVRITESQHTLTIAITGEYDRFGVFSSTPAVQLQTNIAYLWTNVIAPPAAPTSTVAATLVMPDATTRTADIQVTGFDLGEHVAPFLVEAFLHITIPAGRFA